MLENVCRDAEASAAISDNPSESVKVLGERCLALKKHADVVRGAIIGVSGMRIWSDVESTLGIESDDVNIGTEDGSALSIRDFKLVRWPSATARLLSIDVDAIDITSTQRALTITQTISRLMAVLDKFSWGNFNYRLRQFTSHRSLSNVRQEGGDPYENVMPSSALPKKLSAPYTVSIFSFGSALVFLTFFGTCMVTYLFTDMTHHCSLP